MSEPSSTELRDRQEAAHPSAGHQGHNTTFGGWVAVVLIIGAFIVGGIALIEWVMWLFWVAVGITVVGIILGWAVGLMEQVTEYQHGGRGGDPGATTRGS